MTNGFDEMILNMTDTTAGSRRITPGRTGFYTAANAGNPKKPISRRARPFSGVTATRQSATASGQPVRNGKPPRSGAATLKLSSG